jgi:signal transduction histidine kinase
MKGGVRRRLTSAFVVLSVIPLVAMGALFARLSFVMLEKQALDAERRLANHGAALLHSYLSELETELSLTGNLQDLRSLGQMKQSSRLALLAAHEHAFEELVLLDDRGHVAAHASRQRLVSHEGVAWQSSEEFRAPTISLLPYYGPMEIDSGTGEPTLLMSLPMLDLHSGRPWAVLVARVGLKRIWDLIAGLPVGRGESLYVVDSAGAVVAHQDPSVVLRGTHFGVPLTEGIARGLYGTQAVVAVDTVEAGNRRFSVVAEQAVGEAFALGFKAVQITVIVTLAALAAAFVFAMLVMRSLLYPLTAMAETARAVAAGELSKRVAVSRKDELGVLAEALNAMAAQLQGDIDSLEKRVAERTAELEAFSYSVSHDLRAPLRAMNGFSRIVLEEDAALLPPESVRRLNLIQDNSRRMSELIDALLDFSRLGRHALARRKADTAALVREALDVVAAEQGQRRIEFIIGDLPPCECDPILLKQVWVNLISNAVKFTRGREGTWIEIGCLAGEGAGRVYFVRDNGVGFDMRYADKLFGVFQRLHSTEAFEGNGIGLATARRIVTRHGGRMWAEAEVEKGATFYFCLGDGGS